jgi:hypothetical protein
MPQLMQLELAQLLAQSPQGNLAERLTDMFTNIQKLAK